MNTIKLLLVLLMLGTAVAAPPSQFSTWVEQPWSLEVFADHGKLVLTITPTGEIVVAPGATPTEAAREFIKALRLQGCKPAQR